MSKSVFKKWKGKVVGYREITTAEHKAEYYFNAGYLAGLKKAKTLAAMREYPVKVILAEIKRLTNEKV